MAMLEEGIHLFAQNDVSRELAKLAQEFIGLQGHVDKFNKGLKDILHGGIKIGAALGMAEFIADLTKANGLLERQLNIFRMAGNSAADTEALRRRAYESAVMVRGVGAVEQVKLGRELSSALQDNPGARAVLPDFARASAVIDFATGKHDEEATTRLAKMIELRGGAINEKTDKIDAEMFRKELNAATKAIVAGQGLLTTNDLQQMIKQGGPVLKNMRGNPDAFWRDYLAAAEDMNGSRAGTAATAIARQFLGGIMTPKVAGEFERLGMFNAEGWHKGKKGKITIDDPAKAIKGYDELLHGGVKDLVDKVIRPVLKAHGYDTAEKQNAELYNFGSTETARRMMGLFLSNAAQIEAVGKRYDHVMGTDGFDKVVKQDLLYNINAVGEAMHTLASALGDAAHVAPILGAVADGINRLAKVAADHPHIGTAVTFGGAAAAATVGAAGAVQVARGIRTILNGGLAEAAAKITGAAGLSGAAAALTASAAALDAAAVKLAGGSALNPLARAEAFQKKATGAAETVGEGAAATTTAKAVAKTGLLATAAELGGLVTAAIGTLEVLKAYKEANPDKFHAKAWGAYQPGFAGGKVFGPFLPEEAKKDFGPYRYWVDGQVAGRGRAATPGHWELGKDAKDAAQTIKADYPAVGKQAGADIEKGFKSADFPGAGKQAGSELAKGFKSEDLSGAGKQAGHAAASGFASSGGFASAGLAAAHKIIAAFMAGLGGAAAAAGEKGFAPISQTHVHKIHLNERVIAESVTRHQAYAGTFPTGVGGMDAHSSFASPGTPFIDAA